jgi:ABC-type sugar transport system permease subunit
MEAERTPKTVTPVAASPARGPLGPLARRGRRWPLLYFLPTFILLALVFLYPIYYAGWISLYATRYFRPLRYVGTANYARVVTDPEIWTSVRNSLVFGVGSLAGAVPLGLGLALLLHRLGRVKGPLRALVLTPWVMSQAVVGVLWLWILNPSFGPVARLVEVLGFPKLVLFSDPRLAMPTLIAITVWWSYPLVMILILGALQTVPLELYESVVVDGGTRWVGFRHVTFPFIRNTLASTVIMLVLLYFNMVTLILVTTGGGPTRSTETFSLRIFYDMFARFRLSDAAAEAVLLLVLNLILTGVFIRIFRRREALL